MLRLKLPTDPRWVNLAEMSLEYILTDHAYCELKATTACISLVQSFPDKIRMVEEVSPVVTEEWGHFRLVLKEIKKRNLRLGRQRKDEYVLKLREFELKGGKREDRFMDRLLTCALIEARSCERFRLLSENLSDANLRNFYHKFMVSEAGHYVMFIELARHYGGREKADIRWQEYLEYEAKIMKNIKLRGDRVH